MSRVNAALVIVVFLGGTAFAGQTAVSGGSAVPAGSFALPAGYDGPPAPIPPEVITRDASGARATIRAVRLTSPLKIDGKLDEEIYKTVKPITDFIQQEPREGEAATEKTEIWFFFDDANVYMVGRCWDSHPDREIATEMRRDGSSITRNENLAFSLDTFLDHRNGYNFEITPLGGRMDGQISNDGGSINTNWNSVWDFGTARFEQGWTVEMKIPFKTLRYKLGPMQVWGFQVRRLVRWKNEYSYVTRIPASLGLRGLVRFSLSPALVGLEVPPPAKDLEVKPYVVSSLSTDMTVNPRISNNGHGDWGGDVKYGVTKSLTADFTYNTDFAQVEADLQQVNLTRFSLFFPEKRDFFLENSGAFLFANVGSATPSATDPTPALFYSRRIGLSGFQAVPLVAGGRLSGRVGKYTVGFLNVETDEVPPSNIAATNFAVVRVKRDILGSSSIGAMFTGRSVGQSGVGHNEAYGLDTALNLTTDLAVNAFLARTHSPGHTPDNISYKVNFDYESDRYGALVDYLTVDRNFNPEVGFVRRLDMRRSYGQFRFSPRPANRKSFVRKYFYDGTAEYITNTAGRVENKRYTGEFAIDFQNSDHANIKYSSFYEYLPTRLTLGPDVVVPVGTYDYRSVLGGYNFGQSHKNWGTMNSSVEYGTFYGGHKTSINVTTGNVSWPPHLMVEPTYTFNSIDIPQGSLAQNLVGPRVNYMVTPLAFLSALVQYNSTTNTLSSNVRFRWEYQPGSEIFVVWNEQHDTFNSDLPLQNRALIVKFNHLFRF